MGSKRLKRPKKKNKAKKPKKQPKFMSLNSHHPRQASPTEENDPQVACLLKDSAEPGCMPTITDLFSSSASSCSVPIDEALSPASPSVVEWDGEVVLARRALKGRERWVFCRDEIHHHRQHQHQGLLQLKLDYDEVMTAWSDRGPLYIDGDWPPQVVPDLQCQDNLFVEVGNAAGWRVPEVEITAAAEGRMNREERVMRYKAKRQSRLFSKRIRYQVRKRNAEKRPRIKGRFVKRDDDMEET